MAVQAVFRIDTFQRGVDRLIKAADPMCARALNRAGGTARTKLTRLIAGDMRLKAGTVRERISLSKASAARPVVRLVADRRRIPLEQFGAKGKIPSGGIGRGVTARTPTGKYPHAFRARMPSGHVGVFQRVGRRRLPIRELKGPSIALIFDKYKSDGVAAGRAAFVKNIEHELRRAIARAA